MALSLATPSWSLRGGGQAHRHPVGHEQDQGRSDVDGEEGRRGPFEVPPLAAAEQVLVAWVTQRTGVSLSFGSFPSAGPGEAAGR